MRSLPPPRITKKRRWKRIKRALRAFFNKGYMLDPGAFYPYPKATSKNTISTIRRSRLTSRFRKSNFTDEIGLKEGANAGLKTLSVMRRLARGMSVPVMRPVNKNRQMNVTVKF